MTTEHSVGGAFSHKKSTGHPAVQEQVDETEESVSGQINMKLGDKQSANTRLAGNKLYASSSKKLLQLNSPKHSTASSGSLIVQSTKGNRLGVGKTIP